MTTEKCFSDFLLLETIESTLCELSIVMNNRAVVQLKF